MYVEPYIFLVSEETRRPVTFNKATYCIMIELKLTFETELVTGIHFLYYLLGEIFSFILVNAKHSREMSELIRPKNVVFLIYVFF